jgi:DNA-binding winged helix-turn-helix (wHTH) protein
MPINLQSQPSKVLATLVEHAGDVVTRETLQSAVWQSDTHVDFERGLNFCIAQIRSALGDSAESPKSWNYSKAGLPVYCSLGKD